MQAVIGELTAFGRKMKLNRVDIWLYGYLAGLVLLFANGGRLAAWVRERYGAMPVRGGLWNWVWSIDRAGEYEIGLFILSVVVGGAALWTAERWLRPIGAIGRPWVWAGLSVAAAVFFWYGRLQYSLGDSLVNLIRANAHLWFNMSQPLSTVLFAAAFALLEPIGWPVAPSVAIVNCLAGGLWVYTLGRLASELPRWPGQLLLACGLLTGGVALFFGYGETTPPSIAAGALYIYLARHALAGRSPMPAALALGLTVPLHGQMLYLLPSFGLVMLAAWRAGRRRATMAAVVLAALPTVIVVGIALANPALRVDLYGDALGGGDQRMFVPLFKVESGMEHYTLFSLNYWTELLNMVVRATPLLGVMALPIVIAVLRRPSSLETWFMLAVIAGAMSFFLLWNPDLGMPHDWDLFTPPLMLITVACACLWPAEWTPGQGTIWMGAAIGFSIVALNMVLSNFAPAFSWDIWSTEVRPEHPLRVRFGEEVELLGYGGLRDQYAPGEALAPHLFWRGRRRLSTEFTVGLYLIRTEGTVVTVLAQEDHRPAAFIDRYSPEWIVGEVVYDARHVVIPPETPPGRYQVWVVVYELVTATRLSLAEPQGQDYLVLAEVDVSP